VIRNLQTIRDMSLAEAERLGYPINPALPLLDGGLALRAKGDIAERLLCLHAAVAASFGFPKERAIEWLEITGLSKSLSADEREFLHASEDETRNRLQNQVDSLWVFAWLMCSAPGLDFGRDCPNELVALLPNLKAMERPDSFLAKSKLRDFDSVLRKCDLAYCLHWAIRDAALQGKPAPGRVNPIYVLERRRALEWAVGSDDWDDVALDT
jgi:hypothetical protein